jgi:hypothetical protein
MANADDMNLVREYAVGKSDPVFATIVARHINLVYSAAFRLANRQPKLASSYSRTCLSAFERLGLRYADCNP